VEEEDSDKIKKTGSPENPEYLYVKGKKTEKFDKV